MYNKFILSAPLTRISEVVANCTDPSQTLLSCIPWAGSTTDSNPGLNFTGCYPGISSPQSLIENGEIQTNTNIAMSDQCTCQGQNGDGLIQATIGCCDTITNGYTLDYHYRYSDAASITNGWVEASVMCDDGYIIISCSGWTTLGGSINRWESSDLEDNYCRVRIYNPSNTEHSVYAIATWYRFLYYLYMIYDMI